MVITDSQVLEQLYRAHYRYALLYTTALCQDAELAKDITADAFLKAYLCLPEDIPSFRYWLLRVCRNLWIDHLRKYCRETDAEPLKNISGAHSPETKYLQDERSQCLWRAIGDLPPPDRELITLHYISGISLKETAKLVGKSYPSIRQRMVRLRQTLKSKLEEQGYGYDI